MSPRKFSLFNITYCEELKKGADVPLPDLSQLPPQGELPALVQQAQEQEIERAKLTNPGLYEHAQNEVKRVLSPDIFDGCRFELHKPFGNAFAVSHTMWLGSHMIPGGFYQFGANAILGDNAQDPPTLLISRISPDGRLDARWHQKLSDKVSMRMQSQLSNDPNASQVVCDFDYRSDDFNGNVKLSNGPLLGVSYIQSITNQLAMGGEGYYHAQHNKSILSYCSRYSTDGWTGIATYGSIGTLQLHYLRKLSDRTRLATEFVYNSTSGESSANVGAEFTLRQSRFLTNIDHTGKISSTLESKITPMVTFLLSAEAVQSQNEFKFGYGLQIGQ